MSSSVPAGAIAPAVALIILDGFGLAPDGPGNAVSLANTPTFDSIWGQFPKSQLQASGLAVGLPEGQMGNSEVGHLNLGAGAVIKQDLVRIDETIASGQLGEVAALRTAMVGDGGEAPTRVHLVGLVSEGGVHSSMRHLKALIELGKELAVPDVVIHAFSDGRDTLPHSGAGYLETVEGWCAEAGNARFGSVIGRYFAMDRDSRWDRISQAYDLLVHGKAQHRADSAVQAVKAAYDRDETDEFVIATTVGEEAQIRPGDSVIVFNFRPDRVREITLALADPEFTDVNRGGAAPVPADHYVCMTEYKADWPYPVAFPPSNPEVTLAEVIADSGLRQLHVAETEKYPHVTYFFNGGIEQAYDGETRDVVPSPRDVATYDLKPEMAARANADAFIKHWNEDEPAFGIINFANPDMVGHTGSIPAVIKAIEFVDNCLADVLAAVAARGGVAIVTADHGNADNMLEPDGSPNTAHSLNPVPFVITREGLQLRDEGVLADVAPTALHLLGIKQPAAMTGKSMIGGLGHSAKLLRQFLESPGEWLTRSEKGLGRSPRDNLRLAGWERHTCSKVGVTENPQDLVDALSLAIGQPILLDDPELRPLAHSKHWGELDLVRSQSILRREVNPEVRAALMSKGIVQLDRPTHLDAEPELGLAARVCSPIRDNSSVGSEPLGYLWLLEVQEQASEAVVERLARTSRLLAPMLAGSSGDAGVNSSDLLRCLISADAAERASAAEEALALGLLRSGPVVACAVESDDPAISRDIANLAIGRLARGGGVFGQLGQDSQSLLLLSTADPLIATLLPESLPTWLAQFLGDGVGVGPTHVCFAQSGVGSVHDCKRLVHEAQIALRIARTRESGAAVWSVNDPDMLVAQIPAEASEQVPRSLAELIRRDDTLSRTLATYLECGCDVKEAARKLSLHRSGLYYRLDRIEEQTGLDLHRGSDQLLANLAVRIIALHG